MESAYRRCGGLDIHKKSISVCILPPVGHPGEAKEETFRTFTRDLRRLRAWLISCRVTELVMESTGQYWRPVWNILEGAVAKMLLVNPLHVKALAGRKTDRQDARWLAKRLEQDELIGSFVPSRELRELRELTRLRAHWLQDANRVQNRIGDVCESGNIKVSSVASDLFGQSSRAMLKAIVEGKRDAGWMADYARGRLRSKKGQLELALQGTFTDHQRHMLASLLGQLERLEQMVGEVSAEVEQKVVGHADLIARLDAIPGIDRIGAWTVLGEIGFDMSVFQDAHHLASWAGLCPGNRESGGKRLGGKTRKGDMYLRRILCQCAWAAARTHGSQFATLYRRVRSRRGHQKAIMAVAHQLLVTIYHLVRDGSSYIEPGEDYLDQKNKTKAVHRLIGKLHRLGYQVDLKEVQPLPDSPPLATSEEPPPVPLPAIGKRGRPCKCAERGIPCKHNRAPKSLPKMPDDDEPIGSVTG